MTIVISVILNLIQNQADPDFRQDDDSRAVIPDLIRNLCYYQKTQILTFVRMTVTGRLQE